MGISGLLQFLAPSTEEIHVSKFENQYVAIDAYCWLHRGIYSCAYELAMKKKNTQYVSYCMRYIDMLQFYKVKPILVFDGRYLSSKEETEKKRRIERTRKYNKGITFIRAGKINEGQHLLGESVDVGHELAINLIKECRKRNIDCIVAPYEADAQLSFLSLNKIVACIITEDSDLLVYGCEKVLFKMDKSGRGKLVERNKIYLSLGMKKEEFTLQKFRYMCILSGCDYLPSLPSIGLSYALKFVKHIQDEKIEQSLRKLPIYLNKPKITVTPEYIKGFKIADNTFKHQLVYDPFQRKQVPLTFVNEDSEIVGKKLSDYEAFQLAIGNIDPITMEKVDNYDPDKCDNKSSLLWKPTVGGNIVNDSSHVPNLTNACSSTDQSACKQKRASEENPLEKEAKKFCRRNTNDILSRNSMESKKDVNKIRSCFTFPISRTDSEIESQKKNRQDDTSIVAKKKGDDNSREEKSETAVVCVNGVLQKIMNPSRNKSNQEEVPMKNNKSAETEIVSGRTNMLKKKNIFEMGECSSSHNSAPTMTDISQCTYNTFTITKSRAKNISTNNKTLLSPDDACMKENNFINTEYVISGNDLSQEKLTALTMTQALSFSPYVMYLYKSLTVYLEVPNEVEHGALSQLKLRALKANIESLSSFGMRIKFIFVKEITKLKTLCVSSPRRFTVGEGDAKDESKIEYEMIVENEGKKAVDGNSKYIEKSPVFFTAQEGRLSRDIPKPEKSWAAGQLIFPCNSSAHGSSKNARKSLPSVSTGTSKKKPFKKASASTTLLQFGFRKGNDHNEI